MNQPPVLSPASAQQPALTLEQKRLKKLIAFNAVGALLMGLGLALMALLAARVAWRYGDPVARELAEVAAGVVLLIGGMIALRCRLSRCFFSYRMLTAVIVACVLKIAVAAAYFAMMIWDFKHGETINVVMLAVIVVLGCAAGYSLQKTYECRRDLQ